ncbi:MAG: hypothetical protein E4H36_05195 [Spirochaetales bacterium]|nr:MAG: hypothetical protein E4H36_05195 [Spirochaetales bacterium]
MSITVDGLADPVVINLTGSGNYRPTLKGGMGVYSGNPAVAGIYTEYATINSKLAYKRGNSGTVYYMYYIPAVVVPGFWVIDVSDSLTDSGTAMYRSAESVTSPDLVTTWNTSENFPVFNVDNVTGPVIAGDAFYANTNSTVYAYYLYDDKDGDAENGTTFQWYRCDSVDESNVGAAISGADSSSYLITNSDLGSWLKVEVMPKSASGISEGQPVKSAASPQITNAAILE